MTIVCVRTERDSNSDTHCGNYSDGGSISPSRADEWHYGTNTPFETEICENCLRAIEASTPGTLPKRIVQRLTHTDSP